MAEAFGPDRPAAVCRELTKTHEEVRRGPLADLVAWAAEGVRGEVTVVVQGATDVRTVGPTPDDWRTAVTALESAGTSRKTAIADVARAAAVPKREVYDAVHRAPSG